MIQVFDERAQMLQRIGEDAYYDVKHVQQLINEDDTDMLWSECNERTQFRLQLEDYVQMHPEYAIKDFCIDDLEPVIFTEYAPKIFRNIRKNANINERDMFENFMPVKNMNGMYNFKPGDGKSPSFFFFTDNSKVMLKTLKESEIHILIKHNFLLDYFKHVQTNPDTLLMKFLGMYQIQFKEAAPIYFIITENMVGLDKNRISRTFDLKGSTHGRMEQVSQEKLLKGMTGL